MVFYVGAVVLLSMCLVSWSQKEFSSWTRRVFKFNCWDNNIVPYYIGDGFSEAQVDILHQTMDIFHSDTCLRWIHVPPDNDQSSTPKHHLEFQKVNYGRCLASRRLHNNQSVGIYIKLRDYCFTQNALLHEMMHALGFHHEHQRSDRNCYVSIAETSERLPDYKIRAHEPWLERYPYDKYSILHYPRSAVMKSLREGDQYPSDFLGNAHGQLTHMDLSKVLYKFCGGPHYCDDNPEECRRADELRQSQGCISSD